MRRSTLLNYLPLFVLSSLVTNASTYDVICKDHGLTLNEVDGEVTIAVASDMAKNFDPKLCTHYIYTSAKIDFFRDFNILAIRPTKEVTNILNQLKAKNPKLKFLIELNTINIALRLMSPRHVSNFVSLVVEFMEKNSFDGMNLALTGFEDKNGLATITTSLKKGLNDKNFILSASYDKFIDAGFDLIKTLNSTVNFVNLPAFGFYSPNKDPSQALHPHPLYSDNPADVTIDRMINHWLNKGFPASKINLILPTTGFGWTLTSIDTTPPAPADGPAFLSGVFKFDAIHFRNICPLIRGNSSRWKFFRNPKNYTGPYVVAPATSNPLSWIGYDDIYMTAIKANYIVAKKLRGAYVEDIYADDFNNTCRLGFHPVTSVISNILLKSPLNFSTIPVTTSPKPKVTTKLTTLRVKATASLASSTGVKLNTTLKPKTTSKPATTAKPTTTTKRQTTAKPTTTTKRQTTAKPKTTTKRQTNAKQATTLKSPTTVQPKTAVKP